MDTQITIKIDQLLMPGGGGGGGDESTSEPLTGEIW